MQIDKSNKNHNGVLWSEFHRNESEINPDICVHKYDLL